MEIKHKKMLVVASSINFIIGAIYFICAILEFTGIINTQANTVTRTIGYKLSHLVLISDILAMASGGISLILHKNFKLINLQVILGVMTLAWPVFLSVSLLFSLMQINIRLLTLVLASSFYAIAILTVKITNSEFLKKRTFNPAAIISSSGKKAQTVNVASILSRGESMTKKKNIVHKVTGMASNLNRRPTARIHLQSLFTAGKRKQGAAPFGRVYAPKRRRHSVHISNLFNGRRGGRPKRRRFF